MPVLAYVDPPSRTGPSCPSACVPLAACPPLPRRGWLAGARHQRIGARPLAGPAGLSTQNSFPGRPGSAGSAGSPGSPGSASSAGRAGSLSHAGSSGRAGSTGSDISVSSAGRYDVAVSVAWVAWLAHPPASVSGRTCGGTRPSSPRHSRRQALDWPPDEPLVGSRSRSLAGASRAPVERPSAAALPAGHVPLSGHHRRTTAAARRPSCPRQSRSRHGPLVIHQPVARFP